MKTVRHGVAIVVVALVSAPLGAQAVAGSGGDTGARSLEAFSESCTQVGPDLGSLLAAAGANPRWHASETTVNVRAFDAVPSLPKMYWYDKPTDVKVWTEEGEFPLRLIIATFGKKQDRAVCAVVASDIDNAMPYADRFDTIAKAAGMKRKSTDLPHYFQYGGKTVDGRYTRADIFSRSSVTGERRAMHLAFGFVTNLKGPQ